MLRLIVRCADESGAINVGSPVEVYYRTFDVGLPEVEAYLCDHAKERAEIVGVEAIRDGAIRSRGDGVEEGK